MYSQQDFYLCIALASRLSDNTALVACGRLDREKCIKKENPSLDKVGQSYKQTIYPVLLKLQDTAKKVDKIMESLVLIPDQVFRGRLYSEMIYFTRSAHTHIMKREIEGGGGGEKDGK